MTKMIPLTQGKFAIVDDVDFEMLSKFKWCARRAESTFYACRKERINGRQHQQQMHRMILCVQSGMVCDHVNGNGLDNRRSNIRACTAKQNSRNRQANKSHIGFKGVSKVTRNRYQAQIKVDGNLLYLGMFDNDRDAAIAYNNAAIKYFGEFARLNKV